jgi:hypothetical protein
MYGVIPPASICLNDMALIELGNILTSCYMTRYALIIKDYFIVANNFFNLVGAPSLNELFSVPPIFYKLCYLWNF